MLSDPSVTILMYFVLPVWFIAGFADWICHRATSIETTSGVKESAIHALMFVEVGLILLPGLFLEINSLVIALAIAIFVIHEATALWDISYAVSERYVSPYEQMVHSFLEIVPLMAIGSVVALHWGQFLATFGYGPDVAGLALRSINRFLLGICILSWKRSSFLNLSPTRKNCCDAGALAR